MVFEEIQRKSVISNINTPFKNPILLCNYGTFIDLVKVLNTYICLTNIHTMKKLLIVLAIVFVYAVSISTATAGDKKDKKEKAKTENCATVEKSGCSEAQKKECATAGKSCCAGKKVEEKKVEDKK